MAYNVSVNYPHSQMEVCLHQIAFDLESAVPTDKSDKIVHCSIKYSLPKASARAIMIAIINADTSRYLH